MTPPLVKICGITNFADALFCASAGADFLGFIFYNKSPRFVEPHKAKEIIKKLPGNVTPVGVFVNEERRVIENIILTAGIRVVQLSGDESPEDCLGFSIDVWKAFRMHTLNEARMAENFTITAALLDGVSAGHYGGTGVRADSDIAIALKKHHKLILAGGLNPENITEAISRVQPYAVDINSGVEFVPGKKNQNEVQRLFQHIHNYRNSLC